MSKRARLFSIELHRVQLFHQPTPKQATPKNSWIHSQFMILIFNPIFTLGWSTVVKDNRRIRFSLTNVSLPFLLPKRNHHSCFPTTVYPIYTSPTHRVRPTKKRTQSARTRHGPRSTAVNQLLTSADPHFFTSQCPVTCHPDWPIADPFQPPGKRTPCSKSCAQHTPRCCVLATATHLLPSLPPSSPSLPSRQ